MRCDETKKQLYAYFDGELAGERAEALARHLRQCPDCAAEAAAIQRFYAASRRLPSLHLPPNFAAATVREALLRAQPFDFRAWWQELAWSWRWAVGAATMAGLMLGIISYHLTVFPPDSPLTSAEGRFLVSDASLSENYALVVWKGDK